MDASAAQGVQVGDGNTQVNNFSGDQSRLEVNADRNAYAAGRDLTINHNYPAEPRPEPPVVVGDIPQEPAAFQPRAGLMQALEQDPAGPVRVVSAVTGIRGVGKTQVAAAYARRRIAEGWRLVAWVDASNEASLLAGLALVAEQARVGRAGEDALVLAGRVRPWLEADGQRRLMVFDNADNLDVLRPYVPASGAAQVVVTSSRQSAAGLGMPVPVEVFTEAEALAFLAERTGLDDATGACELADEMGRLPLGLAQAAALIARQHLDYPTYLVRLRAQPVTEYLQRVLGDAYRYRLAEAITLSLLAVEENDPSGVCRRLMGLVGVLAETGVPRKLLHAAAQVGALGVGLIGPPEIDAAVGDLADASLLGFTRDDQSVVAHRLIMRVARERLAAEGGLSAVLDGSAVALAFMIGGMGVGGLEEPWRDPAWARDLVGQVSALVASVSSHPGGLTEAIPEVMLQLRLRSVSILNMLGDTTELAVLAAEPLVADFERRFGPDSPDTLSAVSGLAAAYRAEGRRAEAIPLFERTLADAERLLGADHRDTLAPRNNLASAYREAGRTAEAIPLFERTLAASERLLGPDDFLTLTIRNNLAVAYLTAGRIAEAIAVHEQTLADRERLLGTDHPDTLESRSNLARAYLAAGRVVEAFKLYKQNLADRERVLGADNPSVLNTRNNLAMLYEAVGRTAKAITLLERTVADCERLLGPDHPNTKAVRENLAALTGNPELSSGM